MYYDDGKLDAKLSYIWRECYLAETSADFSEPSYIDDFGQLDFSKNYNLNDQLQLQFQMLNVSDENMIGQTFRQEVVFLPYGVTDLNRRFLPGIRYQVSGIRYQVFIVKKSLKPATINFSL
ncbi:hypothetical protein [Thalassomonas sp. RHCl1]|uniref:hypothetical protein n=1 Tax=Thalassomonas sp. RHCl1 TaxID=2995320 RepID=UPI00248BFA30|nr:hypothetical protein [Thalassomonas sp. RHCl1]